MLQSFSEEVTCGHFYAKSKSPFISKGHVSCVNEMKRGGGMCYFLTKLHPGMLCHSECCVDREGGLTVPDFRVDSTWAPLSSALWSQLPLIASTC